MISNIKDLLLAPFKRSAKEEIHLICDLIKEHDPNHLRLQKHVALMRHFLYADDEEHPIQPSINEIYNIVQEARARSLLLLFIRHFHELDFESKKNATAIYSYLIKYQPLQDLIAEHPEVLTLLVSGYDTPYGFMYGTMLRDCLRIEKLCKRFIESRDFFKLFKYMDHSNFEIASDAYCSFKECMTRFKNITLAFLESHYEEFMTSYNNLILSAHYVTKRMAIRVLTELLSSRALFKIMSRFVNEADKYEWVMICLLDTHKNIQLEAFYLFKLFVMNPRKSDDVKAMLTGQKSHLLSYLTHLDIGNDEQLTDDLEVVIQELRKLD